jgi:hypothetical protein
MPSKEPTLLTNADNTMRTLLPGVSGPIIFNDDLLV